MGNVEKDRGGFKTRAPWFKCFPTDWLEGTRGLTPEQRGVYIDCLCLIYRDDKPLPDNGADGEKRMAFALHISTRLWRSVRKALINSGKLIETPDGLINVRAQVEIGSRSVQPRVERESAAKNGKTPEVSTCARARSQTSESDTELEREGSAVAAPPSKPDSKSLYERLITAANGALDNPVNCQGLLNTAVPQMWLERGADLDRDVIPTLEAAGVKHCGKRIRDWSYFTGMVAETKTKRERGLPEVAAGPATGSASPFEDWRSKRQRANREFLDMVRSMPT